MPPPPSTSLCDLPREVLDMILEYAYEDHNFTIRATCSYMRASCDNFLMDLFNRKLIGALHEDPLSYKAIVYRVVVECTQAFLRYEVSIPFLLGVKQVFEKPQKYFTLYLRKYFQAMNVMLGGKSHPQRQFLFTANFMCMLEKFMFKDIQMSQDENGDQLLHVEIPGVWIAVQWHDNTTSHYVDEYELYVILGQLIIASFSRASVRRVYTSENCTFIYGYELCGPRDFDVVPKIEFQLRLRSNEIVREFMFDCLYTDRRNIVWPRGFPSQQIKFDIRFNCDEAAKWDCPEVNELTDWADEIENPAVNPNNAVAVS